MGSIASLVRLEIQAAVILLAVAVLPCAGHAQVSDLPPVSKSIVLTEGETLSSYQRTDETVEYRFDAVSGRTYLIELDQDGLDFIITMETPSEVLRHYNTPLQRDELEVILLDVDQSGAYRLKIHSDEYTGTRAAHSITVSAVDESLAEPELRAWRLMTKGAAAAPNGDSSAPIAAVEAYEEAARAWAALGRVRQQAQAMLSIAMLQYWELSDWNRSAEAAAAAAELYRSIGRRDLYAKAIYVQGYALAEAATGLAPDEAASAFARVLELQSAAEQAFLGLDDHLFDVGQVKNNIGYTYFVKGQWDEARPYWQDAADIYADLLEWGGEIQSRQNLAVIAGEQGQLIRSIESLERIVELLPTDRLQLERASYLNNLADAYRMIGDFDNSLEAYSDALSLHELLQDSTGEEQSLVGLGRAYTSLGELDLAADFLGRALPIAVRMNDFSGEEVIYRFLGIIAYQRNAFEEALTYHEQALVRANSAPTQSRLNGLLARDLRALGRFHEAVEIAEQAQLLASRAGAQKLVADGLLESGLAKTELRELSEAQSDLEMALDIFEELDLKSKQSDVLHGLSLVVRGQGQLSEALDLSESCLALLENSRSGVSDPELRAFYAAQRRSYYETHLQILMELDASSEERSNDHAAAALEVSERARARMLVDLLEQTDADIDEPVDTGAVTRRAELYKRLAELRHQRDVLLEKGGDSGDIESAVVRIVGEMASIENELNVVEAALRSDFTRKPGTAILTAEKIQASIPPDSVLLQYVLGDSESYVFVVSSERIEVVALGSRNVIEENARRVFERLRSYGSKARTREQELDDPLEGLSNLILRPVWHLVGNRHLLISPDGALHYVPIGVLPIGRKGSSIRAIDATDVTVVPSVTALTARQSRWSSSVPSRSLAVFADPILERTDPRLGVQTGSALSAIDDRESPAVSFAARASSRLQALGRLPGTAAEARALDRLFASSERLIEVGPDATVRRVLDTDLSQYRFVHFATHGIVDSRYPALSALALSQFDRDGPVEESFLRLHDVYRLRLNADLVVLSACETAIGREIRGEGLVGFTQAFLAAGARSLVVSLWKIPDRPTAEFMSRFYSGLLNGRLSSAEALRAASLEIASIPQWRDPYFWGAFLLIGGSVGASTSDGR